MKTGNEIAILILPPTSAASGGEGAELGSALAHQSEAGGGDNKEHGVN